MIEFISGIVDARGHIEVVQRHGKPQPRIRVTTKRRDLLEWLAARTGTRVMSDDRGYQRRPCGDHCTDRHQHMVRQSTQWTVDGSRATVVLYNVQPHIVGQIAEVRRALLTGLDSFPPARGNVPTQLEALGWSLPTITGATR